MYEDDFDILGTFTLDSNYNPTFTPSIVFNDTMGFRVESSACPVYVEKFDMTIDTSYNIQTSEITPVFPENIPTPTYFITESAKQNHKVISSFDILSQDPTEGDFGYITFTTNYEIYVEWWRWSSLTGDWERAPDLDFRTNASYQTIVSDSNNSMESSFEFNDITGTSNYRFVEGDRNIDDGVLYELGIRKVEARIPEIQYIVNSPDKFKEGQPIINLPS